MANSNPNIPTVNIITQDPITGYVIEGEVVGVPPAGASYGGIFALNCELIRTDITSGIYINTGTVAVPAWTLVSSGGSTLPSAPVNSVQFNNAGTFGGSADLTWDDVLKVFFINGKLTITGIIDPMAVILSGGTALYFESNDGSTAPVSGVATGRIRYNDLTGTWQVSTQGSGYIDISTGPSTSPISIQNVSSLFSTGLTGLWNSTAVHSNFLGDSTGDNATSADDSNFFGHNTGKNATGANDSNFFGHNAGFGASGAPFSNFFGMNAGINATGAFQSNFYGTNAGNGAASAPNSNFFGTNAGVLAINAADSNFFGQSAGQNATNAFQSSFVGPNAGFNATNANDSIFWGSNAGSGATDANNSNFIGAGAGQNAINAILSNFIGKNAGNGATNAANSIFIGDTVGFGDTVDNTVDGNWSILIGNSAGTGGFSNSIALGKLAINTKTDQFMLADSIINARLRGIEYEFPSVGPSVDGQQLSVTTAGVMSWVTNHGAIVSSERFFLWPIGFGETQYAGTANNGTAVETDHGNTVPFSGVLRNLFIDVYSNTLDAGTVDFTVMVNGVATGITVSVAFGVVSITGDTVNTAAVTAGDRVTIRAVAGGTAGTVNAAFSYEVV